MQQCALVSENARARHARCGDLRLGLHQHIYGALVPAGGGREHRRGHVLRATLFPSPDSPQPPRPVRRIDSPPQRPKTAIVPSQRGRAQDPSRRFHQRPVRSLGLVHSKRQPAAEKRTGSARSPHRGLRQVRVGLGGEQRGERPRVALLCCEEGRRLPLLETRRRLSEQAGDAAVCAGAPAPQRGEGQMSAGSGRRISVTCWNLCT